MTIGIHLSIGLLAATSALPLDYVGRVNILVGACDSIMTCRAFRSLKLSQFKDTNLNGSTLPSLSTASRMTIQFRSVPDDS